MWFDRGLMWCFGYNHDESVVCFQKAVKADPDCAIAYWGIAYSSGCNYNKPWEAFDEADAMRSVARAYDATRHALAALLLEQGHVEESAAVYKADLGLDSTLSRACQHPDNVWSLHGYHDCLTRLGRTEEAGIIKQRLDLANARTDIPVKSSCFCKMGSF